MRPSQSKSYQEKSPQKVHENEESRCFLVVRLSTRIPENFDIPLRLEGLQALDLLRENKFLEFLRLPR